MKIPALFRQISPLLFLLTLSACVHPATSVRRDTVFQVHTINALLEGVYEGETTFQELGKQGDFGIGTFNTLDGEMIALDGRFFQIRADGRANPVDKAMKTPFSVVTFFEADRTEQVQDIESFGALKDEVDRLIHNRNIFHAIRIDGTFGYVKTRSVPPQTKPYPPLVQVVETQPVFEFKDVQGTFVGFFCPEYMKGINVPGYHFHFLTADRSAGGHVLACLVKSASIQVDETSAFTMVLPAEGAFGEVDLSGGGEATDKALKQVEE